MFPDFMAGRRTRACPESETFVVAAEGARLAQAKGVALLFVPGREGLFEVDPFVSDVWPLLRSGMSIADFRATARAAQRDGAELLRSLRDAGAVVDIATKHGTVPVRSRAGLDLGSLRLSINFTGSGDFAPIRDMVGHLMAPDCACDAHVVVEGRAERVGIARLGGTFEWSPWEQAAPALKIALTDLALESLDGIALHVAMLTDAGEALLLVGSPGAGKSTLSVALGRSGFSLEGDDIAALRPDGAVMALPFPATVKDGAFDILSPLRPDLAFQPIHTRPDGKRVRYLALDGGATPSRRARTVLCLDRSAAAPAGLIRLGAQEGFAALLDGAWSADRKLAPRDFDALAACVDGADFYRMTYTTLAEAISLSRAAWRQAEAPAPELVQ